MKEFKIKLETIKEIQEFVGLVERCPFPVDLVSGRYVVDAKSIMGIFSLDLMSPITLIAHGECDDFFAKIKSFAAEE